MKENKNNTPFKAEDVNWEELAAIGILKDELEMAGELDTLLRGERTNVIALSLVLLDQRVFRFDEDSGQIVFGKFLKHADYRQTSDELRQ